jgi:hypothetical protein
MNVAGLERAERPLAARTAVPYWSAHTALARGEYTKHTRPDMAATCELSIAIRFLCQSQISMSVTWLAGPRAPLRRTVAASYNTGTERAG